MGRLYNRASQTATRRHLRSHGTPAEALLWTRFARAQTGFRFRRQFGVGPYVLDVYCPAARLAVELDGGVHARPEQATHDATRTQALARVGIAVVRFDNREVLARPDAVAEAVAALCQQRLTRV